MDSHRPPEPTSSDADAPRASRDDVLETTTDRSVDPQDVLEEATAKGDAADAATDAEAPATEGDEAAVEDDAQPTDDGEVDASAEHESLDEDAPRTASEAPEYEFSDAQNRIFKSLSQVMGLVGILCFGGALLASYLILIGLTEWQTSRLGMGLLLTSLGAAAGRWTWRGAHSIELIATSEGNDIAHLMDAMRELRALFAMWVLVVFTVVILMGAAVFLIPRW